MNLKGVMEGADVGGRAPKTEWEADLLLAVLVGCFRLLAAFLKKLSFHC